MTKYQTKKEGLGLMIFQPKEGQIFEHFYAGRRIVVCVTGFKTKGNGLYCIIEPDGSVSNRHYRDFLSYRLIAEYQTWQEAVNSKEFKEGC